MTRSSEQLASALRIAAEIGMEQDLICTRCKRAADPDTELLVVVLGSPMCAACAAQVPEDRREP